MNRTPLTPYRPPRDALDTPPVVARVIEESGDELQLRPVECPARHEIAPVVLPEMLAEPEPPAAGRVRFSVLDLLIVTAAISIGLAFWLLGLVRLGLAWSGEIRETHTAYYILRLIAYLLIIYAIADTNRIWTRSAPPAETPGDGRGEPGMR